MRGLAVGVLAGSAVVHTAVTYLSEGIQGHLGIGSIVMSAGAYH